MSSIPGVVMQTTVYVTKSSDNVRLYIYDLN